MAGKIIETIYDLKDQVTAKLKKIGDAFGRARKDNEKASEGIEKANLRSSASFDRLAKNVATFRAAVAAVLAGVGLSKLKDGLVDILNTGERFEDLSKKFTTAFGSFEQGEAALESVRKLADNVPFAFEEVAAAAVELKKRGIDPLDGSLQALIDNAAANDQGIDELRSTIEALGKASLRGEVGTRALVSLTEKGIPVFQLLGRALGKTEEEIRAMAESGKLGAAEIALLTTELGKLRAGAASSEVGDLDAQLIKLRDTLIQVKNDIAQGGGLEVARKQFADLNTEVKRIASSPEFSRLKQSINETFESGTDAARAFIDNIDFAELITEVDQLTSALRDMFTIIEASDTLVGPLFDALDSLTLPFKQLKFFAGQALTEIATLLDQTASQIGETTAEMQGVVSPLALIRAEIELGRIALEAFDDAQRAIKGGLSVEAKNIADALGFLEGPADAAKAKIAELFKTFQTDTPQRLGDVALGLAQVGTYANNVAATVREGLGAELKKLSGEELLKFQQSAQTAFGAMKVSAEEAATVLDPILTEALGRLGVSGELLGQQITASGKQIIATFQTVVDSAVATSDQIEAAFAGALLGASTVAEAQALGAALEAAAQRGRVSLDAAARSAIDLRNRVLELTNAADPLADAFERLGIVSQRELDRIAETARGDFESIRQSAIAGQRSLDDVSRAFVAMAQAQLNAVANASTFEKAQVSAALRAQGAALGLKDELVKLGLVGEEAGKKIAGGADRATAALRDTAAAAGGVADAAADMGSQAGQSASALINVAGAADQAAGSLDGVSAAFLKAAEAQAGRRTSGGGKEANIFKDLQEQNARLEEEIALTRDLNSEFDETEQRIRALRGQYEYLSDDRLRQLAQEQQRLDENRRRREEDAKREQEAAQRATQQPTATNTNSQRAESAARPATSGGGITLNFNPNVTVFGKELPASVVSSWGRQLKTEIDNITRRSR